MQEAKKQDDIPDSIYDQIPLDEIVRLANLSSDSENDLLVNWENAHKAGKLESYLNEEMMGPIKQLCDEWLDKNGLAEDDGDDENDEDFEEEESLKKLNP